MPNIENPYADFLGIKTLESGEKMSKVSVVIKKHHTNRLGYVHGGLLYSLADVAFELTSNAHKGIDAVGITTNMQFYQSVKEGTQIIAIAKEIHLGRKVATYQIEVNSGEKLLASFTGTVYRMSKQ